ncbi:MAG: peroxiredoxin [Pseudomonadota bacterium]
MSHGQSGNGNTSLHEVDWSTLPTPEDDGAADHLKGTPVPSIKLQATSGAMIDLSNLSGTTIVFAYPMTGRPDRALPDNWDMIPGARGCTPQACSFRDSYNELRAAGADHVFGLSTQTPDYQKEAAERLHLPYPLLSDEKLGLAEALNLPRMNVDGDTLLRRLTMIIVDGTIETVFYPVFPPDKNVEMVLQSLNTAGAVVGDH